MKNAAKDISSAGPVDFLFQCQGRPPTFSYVETPDGIETRFATTILSKFAILKELTDSGTLKHSAVSICAPSTSRTSFDPTDPGLSKAYQKGNFGFLHSALRDSAVMDALTLVHPLFHNCVRIFLTSDNQGS